MASKDHWDEILELAKSSSLRKDSPIADLDSERKAQLQQRVYAHIDQQFESETVLDPHRAARTKTQSEKYGGLSWVKRLSSGLRRDRGGTHTSRVPALAIVAFAMISVGLLSTLKKPTGNSDLYLPASIANADLESHIVAEGVGARALVASNSDRRIAFLAGVAQAQLDVAGTSSKVVANNLVALFPDLYADEAVRGSSQAIVETFGSYFLQVSSDDTSAVWVREGYAIELVHLAARQALTTLESGTVNTAMDRLGSPDEFNVTVAGEANVVESYREKRESLIAAGNNEPGTPEKFQRIIELTGALKVIVR